MKSFLLTISFCFLSVAAFGIEGIATDYCIQSLERLRKLPERDLEIIGDDTGENFLLRREIDNDYSYRSYLTLEGETGNAYPFSILQAALYPSQPHIFTISLDRSASGEFFSLNLGTALLEQLHKNALSGESFRVIVNDPAAIDNLNASMTELIDVMGYDIPFPRRVKFEEFEIKHTHYDSVFSGIDSTDLYMVFKNFPERLPDFKISFSEYLAIELMHETKFGGMIRNSADWDFEISFLFDETKQDRRDYAFLRYEIILTKKDP
jgi:hypothetical protein